MRTFSSDCFSHCVSALSALQYAFSAAVLGTFLFLIPTDSRSTESPIYVVVRIDDAVGVEDDFDIEKHLAKKAAVELSAEYQFWTFIADEGSPPRIPYLDLSFEYDDNRANVLFVVQFHARRNVTLPLLSADREYWQIVVMDSDKVSTGIEHDKGAWGETMTGAFAKLREKARGRIRAEIQNYISLGTATVRADGQGIVADLEASNREIRTIYRSDFRVCCIPTASRRPPTLIFEGLNLGRGGTETKIRIATVYDRTCDSSCSEACRQIDDVPLDSLISFQNCRFWLETEGYDFLY